MVEQLGDRVRKRREYWGMSRPELARRAGIQRQQVYMIESNKTRDPGILTVSALAQALRVSVDYLVHGDASTTDLPSQQSELVGASKV